MPSGELRDAAVAGPLSPEKPAVPFPATVEITPPEIHRIRLFAESAIYTLPTLSTATASGRARDARVADPPSPANPNAPVPAIVLIVPPVTLRIRLLFESAI